MILKSDLGLGRANDYFGPIRTNIPHETPNYGPGKSKFEIDYYRWIYSFQKNVLIYEESWKNQVNE